MYTFPDLLKEIRGEANLTQQDLARILGISTILVAMVETGQKQVSKNFIERLAKKLDVHPSSITPFIFIEKNTDTKRLSRIEKTLIAVGEKLQDYLIDTKAKKLKQYA